MRLLRAVTVILLACGESRAQVPYPATPAPPPPAWGGYTLPAQVPYQPTLPGNGAPPPENPAAGQVWQPYPPIDAATPEAGAPFAAPAAPMPAPEYPAYPAFPEAPAEPSLKQSLIPPDARDSFFQKARFTATWMPQLENDSLGWTDLRTEVVTALPFFTRENPIIITPSYELHLLDRPDGFDLPPRLHDAAIDFHIFRVYGNHWIADFAVTPGLFADDHSFDRSDALRINGRALGIYAPDLDWKYVFGVTYVDGGWAKIVPVIGIVYGGNEDMRYELVFPQSRIAWRLPNSPIPGRDDYWAYVKIEYGNSGWAFERSDGTPDTLFSRDYRAILGLEHKMVGGFSTLAEIGYVFHRDLKIESLGDGDIHMKDTFLLRAGISY